MGGKVEHPFKVEQWAEDKVTETVAIAIEITIAIAAFDAAVKARPGRRLTLSHGARLIRSSPGEPPGPPTVGHLKSQGVTGARLWCVACSHSARMAWETLRTRDTDPFTAVGKRLKCSACGGRDIQKMPDWPDHVTR